MLQVHVWKYNICNTFFHICGNKYLIYTLHKTYFEYLNNNFVVSPNYLFCEINLFLSK